jgi:transposase-like protein
VPKRGDTYRFTGERRRAYLDALSDGAGRVAAARAVGVNRSTISRYVVAHPRFGDLAREAECAFDDQVQGALAAKALSGDVKAATAWLAARQPAVWQPTRRVHHSAESVQRVEHTPLSPLEQLAVMEKLEVVGARPVGTADAFRAFLVASGELPAPVLELVAADVADAEVVEPESA